MFTRAPPPYQLIPGSLLHPGTCVEVSLTHYLAETPLPTLSALVQDGSP